MLGNRIPRGIRLNNPGNVRHVPGVTWVGQEATQTDPDFVQFVTPEYGIRAIVRILRSYKRAGLNTISAAINRWAPNTENDTSAYVASVCKTCNISPLSVVDFDSIMSELVKAITLHENGIQPYSDSTIDKGISLAG